MSSYLIWFVLSALTGNPLLAAGLVLLFLLLSGRFAFSAAPPLRFWHRAQRAAALDRLLRDNPHNRSARFERAELYVARGQYARAADMLRPNLARDDDDDTLFVMGVASYGAGDKALGEKLLTTVAERSPSFRYGGPWLELGRFRLAQRDGAGARSLLERYCALNSSSVEGRVLLARACALTHDAERERTVRRDAWQVYTTLPRFQRRRERLWAYRANPARAMVLVALVAAVVIIVASSGAHAVHP
jgi:tetratricopeptide (TPR) repeat protein